MSHISFVFEHGEINEIGTGHKFRCMELSKEMTVRGHITSFNKLNADVVVIDHMLDQSENIAEARKNGAKVVLIDGSPFNVKLVDLSISAIVNGISKHRGIEYLVFPTTNGDLKQDYRWCGVRPKIFVAVGGFDKGYVSKLVINAIRYMSVDIILAKSINNIHTYDDCKNIEVFTGTDYFDAMRRSDFAVTNGGLTLFQAMYFGLPCIAIPQYKHQSKNINAVMPFCIKSSQDNYDIISGVSRLLHDAQFKKNVGVASKALIDGKGTQRVCDLIEGLL